MWSRVTSSTTVKIKPKEKKIVCEFKKTIAPMYCHLASKKRNRYKVTISQQIPEIITTAEYEERPTVIPC